MSIEPEWRTWLGPAWDDMTPDQRERFGEAAPAALALYPDPDDQELRDAALSAIVQYLLGETSPAEAGAALREARRVEGLARAAARQVAMLAVADGGTQVDVARATGVDRMALRSWLGKR